MSDPFFSDIVFSLEPAPGATEGLNNVGPLDSNYALSYNYTYFTTPVIADAATPAGSFSFMGPNNYARVLGHKNPVSTYAMDTWLILDFSSYASSAPAAIIGTACNGGTTYYGYALEIEANTGFPVVKIYRGGYSGAPELTIKGTAAIPLSTWVHIAVVVAGTSVRLYVGGVLVASGTLATPLTINHDYTYMGYNPGYGGRTGPYRMRGIRYTAAERYTDNFTPVMGPMDTANALAIPNLITSPVPTWANNETKAQAWPAENSWKQLVAQPAKKAYSATTVAMLSGPPSKSSLGFIAGVVTRKAIPAAGKHVICLDGTFNLIAETVSATNGYYRFDSLPINGLYAIHAYDNEIYQYAPVGADRRTPEAYP